MSRKMDKGDIVMGKKKFAFLLMGAHYTPELHRAAFETENQITYVYTVQDFAQARERALACAKEGVGAIELCGAFGKEKADELIALTENKVAVGYIVHNPEQDALFSAFFGN